MSADDVDRRETSSQGPGGVPADDAYLWDRTGPLDPLVAELEDAAKELRHRGTLPEPAARAGTLTPGQSRLALAAMFALAIGVSWYAVVLSRPPRRVSPPIVVAPPRLPLTWTIAAASGNPKINEIPPEVNIKEPDARRRMSIETSLGDRASLTCGSAIRAVIEPESSVVITEDGKNDGAVYLARGEMSVDVAHGEPAVSVHLDSDTIEVAPDSAVGISHGQKNGGRVTVKRGWAEVRSADGKEPEATQQIGRRVATEHSCQMWRGSGATIPVRDGDIGKVAEAARAVWYAQMGKFNAKERAAAVDEATRVATVADAPTLWNMLPLVSVEERVLIRDALARLVEAPAGKHFNAVLDLDADALDEWWNACIVPPKSSPEPPK